VIADLSAPSRPRQRLQHRAQIVCPRSAGQKWQLGKDTDDGFPAIYTCTYYAELIETCRAPGAAAEAEDLAVVNDWLGTRTENSGYCYAEKLDPVKPANVIHGQVSHQLLVIGRYCT